MVIDHFSGGHPTGRQSTPLAVEEPLNLNNAGRGDENLRRELRRLTSENQKLENLLTARSQFIRLVTHELKAPLAAVENYLKLILEGYIDLEDQEKILEKCIIRTCEERQLIDDLLDLGRIESISSLPTAIVFLDDVLSTVLDECRDDAAAHNIDLSTDVDLYIPGITAAPELMRSIWCNLVSNALKYTPDGGQVSIGLRFRGSILLGWVSDTGIGISEEDQEKLFHEFFRGDNAKKASIAGTGLGLVLVKKIVEGLGGKISFDSSLGAGSTFRFEIPVKKIPR